MHWPTKLTAQLNITYPIILAPMYGVSTPAMAAAASNAGCLGSLALADLPADKCIELIHAYKKLSDKPYAANIFLNDVPLVTDELRAQYTEVKLFLQSLMQQHGFTAELPELDSIKITDYREQVDAIIAEGCKVLSFTFGNLDADSIAKLKSAGVLLVGTATSVAEAKLLGDSGIDVICVQGAEAGGHRGTFDAESTLHVGGVSLFTEVKDTVKVPLIYAGGIINAKTLLAAQALGAQGYQIGSLLLCAQESALQSFEKERLQQAKADEVVVTNSFSGRYARGLRNTFIEAVEKADYILPYPYQNKLTGALRTAARANKNADFVNLWVGQSLPSFKHYSTGQILKELIVEVE